MRSAVETAEEADEFASWIPVHCAQLAYGGIRCSVPDGAHRLGHTGDLLFEFSVGRISPGAGRSLRDIRDLGFLVLITTPHVCAGDRIVSRRGRVVDIDPPPRTIATGDR